MPKNCFSPFVLFLPALLAIGLAACGGGGGSSSSSPTPTDPNQEFSLHKFHGTSEGTVYQSDLAGTGTSNGISLNITGSILVANRKQEMLGNELVFPKDRIVNLKMEGNVASALVTTYFDANGYLVKTRSNESPPVFCNPTSFKKLPEKVKIGQFDQWATLECSNNTTQTQSWRTEDGKNGHLLLVEHIVLKEIYTQKETRGETTYNLNTAGEIV